MDERTLARVRAADDALTAAPLDGVVEVVPAYTTLTVYYDVGAALAAGAPADEVATWIAARVSERLKKAPKKKPRPSRRMEIPVCYGGEFGPDLAKVAREAKLSEEEVVRRHAKQEYVVALTGFSPGFPYLLGMPKELATPRLAKPRTEVAPGSVGIAGAQTGIYPLATPGGWNLIGRTPLRLFRPENHPPTLLQAGDRVHFRAVTRDEFVKLEGRA
jgi:inhibitor of KinA